MSPLLQKIIFFSLIPVLTMIVGGLIAIVRRPNGSVRSLILHFAAGVVFSVVAVEILPDVVKGHAPIQAIIGFSAGFVLMVGIRHFLEGSGETTAALSNQGLPIALLVAIAVDILVDGVLLGIGFSAGETTGMLLAVALSIELLSLGMATATELGESSVGRAKSIAVIVGLAALFFASALAGATLLHNLSPHTTEIVLSFGVAALLFLVTEELLTEAHEEKETVWHTAAFFIGFLLFLILGMVA